MTVPTETPKLNTINTWLDEISPAIVAALGQMDELRRDKKATVPTKAGGNYSYSYTDIASVLGYVRPILAEHGLVVMQPATADGNTVSVTTILLHKSGQERQYPPLSLPAGRTPQEVGSAITYARRYSLLSALGLATEDDDGKAAQKAAAAPRRPKPQPALSSADEPSPEQTRHAMALFGELGIKDRDARLDVTSAIVGREVGSWKEVTAAEARIVIDQLKKRTEPRGVGAPDHLTAAEARIVIDQLKKRTEPRGVGAPDHLDDEGDPAIASELWDDQ